MISTLIIISGDNQTEYLINEKTVEKIDKILRSSDCSKVQYRKIVEENQTAKHTYVKPATRQNDKFYGKFIDDKFLDYALSFGC